MGRKKGGTKADGNRVGGKKARGGGAKKARGGGAKRSKGGGKGAGAAVAEAPLLGPPTSRREVREAARQSSVREKRKRKKHGGDDAKWETQQRLRIKIVERQLQRHSGPVIERVNLLRELGQLNAQAGWTKKAIDNFKQVLELVPEDPEFVRIPLLCLLMDHARSDDARDLLFGPLFRTLTGEGAVVGGNGTTGGSGKKGKRTNGQTVADATAGTPASSAVGTDSASVSPRERIAAVAGCYSLSLLTYISVEVLNEASDPGKAAEGEKRLRARLRRAQHINPFCMELITFYPAFEPHFPEGSDLPDMEVCAEEERAIREALEYCCCLGQVAVWLDADEEVRRFLRRLLYEEDPDNGDEEKPPFQPLPDFGDGGEEPALIARWRAARNDAMELWAAEMSIEGNEGGEEGGEEEEQGESECSLDSDEAFGEAEEKRFG